MARRFFKLSLRSRLYLVCAILILILLGPAYYTLRQLVALRDIAFDLRADHAEAFQEVGKLGSELSDLSLALDDYVQTATPEDRGRTMNALYLARLYTMRFSRGNYADPSAEMRARFDSIDVQIGAIDSLVANSRMTEARQVFTETRFLFTRIHRSLGSLADEVDTRSDAAAMQAELISTRTARTTAAATGLAAGLAVLVALLSVGAVTAPLGRLRAAMAAVASGSFVPPRDLPYARTDEIGDLTRSFRSMAERLAELDRLKAEFVSIASHELKTPVNVIRGYVEMLEDESYGEVDARQREALQNIREQTDVLRERVNQLLSMSRLEAQGLGVKPERVDVPALFEEVRRNFAGVAAQKRIVFGITCEPSTPGTALLDRPRVRDELLGNLLGNAFKFTPRGGTIHLTARGEGSWLVIEIRDSGEGIPTAELPYVFEKYYQAGHHAGKVGAGLGLAIAREIVEAHGGIISVESERGVGSTFRVELPIGETGTPTIDAVERFRRGAGTGPEASLGHRA
ncbi:MAG: HAMP domain-containing sensor histidine kinase [Gemmatimonadota bacterium]|nr:HAMP domain-containing sensor histidine kinase [Gemmatimonadota bacterium]